MRLRRRRQKPVDTVSRWVVEEWWPLKGGAWGYATEAFDAADRARAFVFALPGQDRRWRITQVTTSTTHAVIATSTRDAA